jgi:hypothetical protein
MGRCSVRLDHLNPVTCREHLRLPLLNLVENRAIEFPDTTGAVSTLAERTPI